MSWQFRLPTFYTKVRFSFGSASCLQTYDNAASSGSPFATSKSMSLRTVRVVLARCVLVAFVDQLRCKVRIQTT